MEQKNPIINRIITESWPESSVENKESAYGIIAGVGQAADILADLKAELLINIIRNPEGKTENHSCVLVSDYNLLPVADSCVDRIVIYNAANFVSKPEELFDEIWRVLKAEGKVFVIESLAESVHKFTPKSLTEIIEKSQFDILKKRKIAEKCNILLFGYIFGKTIIIEAQKKIYNVIPLKSAAVPNEITLSPAIGSCMRRHYKLL